MTDAERNRLQEAHENRQQWYRWGPYLSERQWGTVREDYSPNGTAWDFLPHDLTRSQTYRWGEDGLLGISNDQGLLCFALALQNDAHWRDYIPFHEYFHGESGRGLGASHQTGWTALVANLLQHTK